MACQIAKRRSTLLFFVVSRLGEGLHCSLELAGGRNLDLRVVQPEYRVEGRVRDKTHVAVVSYQPMNHVVDVLNRVVATASSVIEACIREWSIRGLIRY